MKVHSAVAALLLTLALALAGEATAQSDTGERIRNVDRTLIDDGFGVQTDPHVSGDLVSYTDEEPSSDIEYYDLGTGAGSGVPTTPSNFDFLSDPSDGTITFTRVTSDGSAIFAYDTVSGEAVELAPQAGSRRRQSSIGGHVVVWQDFGYGTPAGASEVAVYDRRTGEATRLTDDLRLDKDMELSADGSVIVWLKCDVSGANCDVWRATRSAAGWDSRQLTGADGQESFPATDGDYVVYSSERAVDGSKEQDIYAQPVGGGEERRLAVSGAQVNPNVRAGLVSLEHFDGSVSTPNWDLMLWDLTTDERYRVTETPEDETLNDIAVRSDGLVHVPYSASAGVYAVTFRLDRDGVPDGLDNCPDDHNPDQRDQDGDGAGDACDSDRDGDGLVNESDNCADAPNPGQEDADGDGTGDVCDADRDGDGFANESDNCADTANTQQEDQDTDGMGDACDSDRDGDEIPDDSDNCVPTDNHDQSDQDGDGAGDACDADRDGDGLANGIDNCADVANADQADSDGDGKGDACDPDRPPAQEIAELIDEVESAGLPHGTERSLTAKLDNALRHVNEGRTEAACAMLDSFIREVRAQSGKKIPSAEAELLIADAERIRTALGC